MTTTSKLGERLIGETTFVALDLEATGAAPGHDRIVEIGAARFRVARDGRVIADSTFERLVNPGRPMPGPIETLTGIGDDVLVNAEPLTDVWDEMWAFLNEGDPVLLAHKSDSDLTFLAAAAYRLGLELGDPVFACTLEISRTVFTKAPSHRLGELVKWLGCSPVDSRVHRALPDALHTRNLFGRAVGEREAKRLSDLGVKTATAIPTDEVFDIRVPERLSSLMDAALAGDTVEIFYRGGSKGKAPRLVRPMAFYNYSGHLWMRGYCHIDRVTKSFRADKLRVVASIS